jgi:hypothetical protein
MAADPHPGDPGRLKRYWAFGEGSLKISWGAPGDHTRCVRLVQEAIVKGGGTPLPDHEIHGFCTNAEIMATGHFAGGGRGDK